jgi:hypothetical protein
MGHFLGMLPRKLRLSGCVGPSEIFAGLRLEPLAVFGLGWLGLSCNQVDAQSVIEATGDHPVFTSAISIGDLSFGVLHISAHRGRRFRLIVDAISA